MAPKNGRNYTQSKSLPIPTRRKLKGLRGQSLIYDEKKEVWSLSLTDTAIRNADQLKEQFGLSSRSEAVEVLLRVIGAIPYPLLCAAIRQTFAQQSSTEEETETSINP
jgi:hypothetical protein